MEYATGYTKEEIINNINKFVEDRGKRPTKPEWRKSNRKPSTYTIRNRFGTWNKALKEAGVGINQVQNSDIDGREYYHSVKQENSCANCGENREAALCFHHTDPDNKSFNIGRGNDRSAEAYYDEMKKCVILCQNCHTCHHNNIDDFNADSLDRLHPPKPEKFI